MEVRATQPSKKRPQSCYIHYPYIFNILYSSQHIVCFIYLFTACSTPFEKYNEHNAEGATPYRDMQSVDDCADLCHYLHDCVAFDYDRSKSPYRNTRCWIHDNPSIVMKEQPHVDHYAKGPLVCTARKK